MAKRKTDEGTLGPVLVYRHRKPIAVEWGLEVPGAIPGAWETSSQPCRDKPIGRSACPTQAVFWRGRPAIRFCLAPYKPGLVLPVKTPMDAYNGARAICREAGYPVGRLTREPFTRELAARAGVELAPGLGALRSSRRRR